MNASTTNLIGLEGKEISIETDALAEEQTGAKANYAIFEGRIKSTEAKIPYPDVMPYDTAWSAEDRIALQDKKEQNAPHWEKIDEQKGYFNNGSLYSGHVKFLTGGERYFMESPQLKTVELKGGVLLINVDDKKYKADLDVWRYPDKSSEVAFSRNIVMENKTVTAVDIVLDRSSSEYSHITDNYLRNALRRNKNKTGIQSIIQTIQKKQDAIRSLSKSKSFVVQGCAGSGKTMVLLHRLRYLIYNNDISGSDFYLLVPGVEFKKYIQDVASKFNIKQNNIISYQGYYRMLSNKPDTSLSVENNENVFPECYLSRVYSKEFIQECYGELFRTIADKTNALCEFCDEKLNSLIVEEENRIAKEILSVQDEVLNKVRASAGAIAEHINFEIIHYTDIENLISAVDKLIQKHISAKKLPDVSGEDIVIEENDERILADRKLQEIDEEVATEELRIKKASIFTVNSHKKKHQQLIAKREAYYASLVQRLVAEEKERRAEEVAKLSVVFGNVTISDLEFIRNYISGVYDDSKQILAEEHHKQNNVIDVIQKNHQWEISALTQMIEESAEFEVRSQEWIESLSETSDAIIKYYLIGTKLYSAFQTHAGDRKEQERYRENFKLFARRTDGEQKAYLNTLLFNSCKRKIRAEFDIKICDLYKHYWYLSVYCNYLITGAVSKARPYIFIDEAQDLSQSELELIRKINKYPTMNVFGDTNQVITGHGIADWDIATDGMDVYRLDENFRNTNQIIEFCNRVLPIHMEKIGVDMDKVEECLNIETALCGHCIPNDVAFVVKNDLAADDLKIALEGAPLTGYKIYTVKDVKGLEFNHVVVVDRQMNANERYIAYTRALAKLTVVHDMPAVSDPQISRIIEGQEDDLKD